ncbi:hypothetical protein ACFO5X_07355 [Seohaeicola nanhaiensis]|uniref:Uncharacterized protein n=1 Tax=Seohaeicola nanhaiensis TaxID=1387282 RepID=A0ABV9KEJ8_9RHOB
MNLPLSSHMNRQRAELAAALELAPTSVRIEIMRAAIVLYGGTTTPLRDNTDGGLTFPNFTVLGVTGDGTTEVEAIAEWTKAATRMAIAAEEEVAA